MEPFKPTIGRIVTYRHVTGTFPAMITQVHTSGLIDVVVFTSHATVHYQHVKQGDSQSTWDVLQFTKDQLARPGWKNSEEPKGQSLNPHRQHEIEIEKNPTEESVDNTL